MPQRRIPLVTGQYYHVFNRSINKEPIFIKTKDCARALLTLNYYRFKNPPIRLSYLLPLAPERRKEITQKMKNGASKLVEIPAFVFMPNHFHLLLKQTIDNGISTFLALFQNSYTRYFNVKNSRQGHLFQGQFKAVRIEDENQFLHVNRYIHLNPYASFAVKTLENLWHYQYSSLPTYLGNSTYSFVSTKETLSYFKNIEAYTKFIADQADYQRSLEKIKHLVLE